MLKSVTRDPTGKHKLVARFADGSKLGFGSPTSQTFAEGATKQKRDAYLKRHQVNENWLKKSKGALSRWVLWSAPNIASGVKNYNRKVG